MLTSHVWNIHPKILTNRFFKMVQLGKMQGGKTMGFIVAVGFLILVVTGFSIEAKLRQSHKQNERIIELLEQLNQKS